MELTTLENELRKRARDDFDAFVRHAFAEATNKISARFPVAVPHESFVTTVLSEYARHYLAVEALAIENAVKRLARDAIAESRALTVAKKKTAYFEDDEC